MAEQFVAQQLIAHSESNKPAQLYYWHREARSSNAEVDFVLQKNQGIIPIEVKSGQRGRSKSLKMFLDSHPKATQALKISEANFQSYDYYQQIPFYALEAWLAGK